VGSQERYAIFLIEETLEKLPASVVAQQKTGGKRMEKGKQYLFVVIRGKRNLSKPNGWTNERSECWTPQYENSFHYQGLREGRRLTWMSTGAWRMGNKDTVRVGNQRNDDLTEKVKSKGPDSLGKGEETSRKGPDFRKQRRSDTFSPARKIKRDMEWSPAHYVARSLNIGFFEEAFRGKRGRDHHAHWRELMGIHAAGSLSNRREGKGKWVESMPKL